jgi:malate synthase
LLCIPVEFDFNGKKPNQIDRRRDEVMATPAQLLEVPRGAITEAGLRTNMQGSSKSPSPLLSRQTCVM